VSVEPVTSPLRTSVKTFAAPASKAGVGEKDTAVSGVLNPFVAEMCPVLLSW
jgi:hypothetical protein